MKILFFCRLQKGRRPNSVLFWENWAGSALRVVEGRFSFSNIWHFISRNQSIHSYSQKTVDPVMTAYKLVTIQFKWWEQLFQCQSVANFCCIWNDEMQNCFNMWPTIKVCSMSKMPVSILRAGDVDVDGVWCQFLTYFIFVTFFTQPQFVAWKFYT